MGGGLLHGEPGVSRASPTERVLEQELGEMMETTIKPSIQLNVEPQ
jgi:hypothetical protein